MVQANLADTNEQIILNEQRSSKARGSSGSESTSTMERKRIFLMRHAKSEENEKVYKVCEHLTDFREGRIFSGLSIFGTLYEWVKTSTLDSPLSDLGERQVADMRLILRSRRFWESTISDKEVILHSTLQRAKNTLYGTLPHPSARHGMVIREVESLREATPYEHVDSRALYERIKSFERMLMSEEYDQHRTIVACGHSQYFMKMLKMKLRMNNVDVWEVEFMYDKVNREYCVWGEPKLAHRSEISEVHPWDVFMNGGIRGSEEQVHHRNESRHDSSSPAQEDIVNDLQTDGVYTRVCRICTLTEEETPGKELIRPCSCKGTQEFVHVECLNRWRATSESASEICSVCKYRYKVHKTWLATLLLSDLGAIIITALLVGSLCLSSGALLTYVLSAEWLPSTLINKHISVGRETRWWDHCSPRQYLQTKKWLKLLAENRASFTLVDYLSHLLYGYSGLLLNSKAFCNTTMQSLLSITAEGAFIVTASQLLLFIYKNAIIAIENAPNDRPAVQEARMKLLNVLFLFAPLAEGSLAAARSANLRLVFILGLLLIVKELGSEFRERGRALASSLGEVIMERER